jgi:hypothetical protein
MTLFTATYPSIEGVSAALTLFSIFSNGNSTKEGHATLRKPSRVSGVIADHKRGYEDLSGCAVR